MSNYAEQLHRKLALHSETDLIDIKDDIDTLIELADNAVEEYDELKDEINTMEVDKDEEISSLKDEIEELEEKEEEGVTTEWGLLGEQIKEQFEEIMTNPKCNQIRFLEALRTYNQTIARNKFKSAAI
jgi:hypothetical protein